MAENKKPEEVQEIDVASLDSELAAARTLEEGKGDKFVKIAAVVAFCMTTFHIWTAAVQACIQGQIRRQQGLPRDMPHH